MTLEVLANIAAVGLAHGRRRDRAFANGLRELGPPLVAAGFRSFQAAAARRLTSRYGYALLGRAPLRCGPAYLAFVSDIPECRVRHVSRHMLLGGRLMNG
jgi:hypothetical protein